MANEILRILWFEFYFILFFLSYLSEFTLKCVIIGFGRFVRILEDG